MKMRNWLAMLLVGAIAMTSFQSCSKDDEDNTTTPDSGPTEWFRSTVFQGEPVSGAANFVVGNEEFVVGGLLKTREVKADVWAFNGSSWSRKADLPGAARQMAVGFSIDDVGFVGTGYDGNVALKDFYRYDASTNTWTEIAEFPGEASFGAVAFSLGNYGYVGLGGTPTDRTFSDFYRYDPSNDTWSAVETPFAYKKAFAFSFVIDGKAYVGGGFSNNALPEDFYSFDGTTWTALNDLNRSDDSYTYDVRRYNAAAFAIGGNGYVASGRSGSGVVSTVWKYHPAGDFWTNEHQSLPTAREKAVGFVVDGKAYVTTGSNGTSYFDDNWSFVPVR